MTAKLRSPSPAAALLPLPEVEPLPEPPVSSVEQALTSSGAARASASNRVRRAIVCQSFTVFAPVSRRSAAPPVSPRGRPLLAVRPGSVRHRSAPAPVLSP
jgi:hypothetical protein